MYLIGVVVLLLFLCIYLAQKIIDERHGRMADRAYMYKIMEDRGIQIDF